MEEHSRVYKSTKTHARGLCHSAIHERDRVLRARLRAGLARRPALMAEVRRLDLGAAVRHGDDRSFIVLTETKFSFRCIPVWDRYPPHQTRVE